MTHPEKISIETPCVKLCVLAPEAGLCIGCLRSRSEIAAWSTLSPEERRRIMAELPARRALLVRRRGGRRARLAQRKGDEA